MARPRVRRRIEIGWIEAIVLVFGYVLSLGVVGLGGIYVGQRAIQQRLGAKERVFRLPIDAGPGSAAPGVASDEPDITFYETLGKGAPQPPEGRLILPGQPARLPAAKSPATPPPPPAPKPTGVQRPGAAPKGPDQSIGAGSASGTAAVAPSSGAPTPRTDSPRAKAQPEAGVKPPAPAVRVPLTAPATASPLSTPRPQVPAATEGGANGEGDEEDQDREERGEGALVMPSPSSRVTPEAAATARALLGSSAADPEGRVGSGTWSVQVNATQDRGVADRLIADLRARGYDAFIVTQAREGAVWYRVRVGRLRSLEEANALVVELKEREGLPHAFVASD